MKSYETILSRVKYSLKFYSKDYVNGYIYALLDWWVIDTKTYGKLKKIADDFVNENE